MQLDFSSRKYLLNQQQGRDCLRAEGGVDEDIVALDRNRFYDYLIAKKPACMCEYQSRSKASKPEFLSREK